MTKTVYICKECKYAHSSIVVFQRHMAAVHNKLPVNICKICNEKIIGNDDFDKHLQFTHGTNHWDLNLAMKQSLRDIKKMESEID